MNYMQKQKVAKKLEVAIDKMIDIQDMGFGDDTISRVLEMLNSKLNRVQS